MSDKEKRFHCYYRLNTKMIMGNIKTCLLLLILGTTFSFTYSKHHKEEHHPVFIDNPEPDKEKEASLPLAILPVDPVKEEQKALDKDKEDLNFDQKIKPAELVFHKKYFDDNPLTPPPHDALVPKVVCEDGGKDCEVQKKKDKRAGKFVYIYYPMTFIQIKIFYGSNMINLIKENII